MSRMDEEDGLEGRMDEQDERDLPGLGCDEGIQGRTIFILNIRVPRSY